MTKHVLVPVADGSEDIELACLTDVLVRGNLKVTVASVMPDKKVTLARGLQLTANASIKDLSASSFDAVLLPGGEAGAKNLGKCEYLKKIMHEMRSQNKLYGAICASPVLALGPLGMLEGVQTATCYPGLESKFPSHVHAVTDSVVKDGNCLTSRGPGTALLFALAAVALLQSKETAKTIADALLISDTPSIDKYLSLQ